MNAASGGCHINLLNWMTLPLTLAASLARTFIVERHLCSESNVNIYLKSGGPQSRNSKSDSHLAWR